MASSVAVGGPAHSPMDGMAHVEETDREFANRIAHELEATREELSSSIDPTTSILGDSLVDMEEGWERLQRRQRFIDHERVDTSGPVMHNLSSHSANQTFSSSTSSSTSSPSHDPTSNDQESARNFQMQYTILSLLHQSQNTTLGVWINCIMNIPQVIAIIYYLYIYYRDAEFARVHANVYSQCEKPLYFWAGVHGVRLCFTTFASILLCNQSNDRMNSGRRNAVQLRDSLNLCGLVWFFIGNFWLFLEPSPCQDMSPTINKLCMGLLIVNYVVILLPCLTFFAFLPLLFYCLPSIFPVINYIPDLPQNSSGVTEDLLSKLPKLKFQTGMLFEADASGIGHVGIGKKHDDAPPECCICKVEYDEGVEVRALPCSTLHHFHAECVDMWLKRHSTCPLCRKSVLDGVSNEIHP